MSCPPNFADKCCKRFHCPRPAFAEAVFWNCLLPLRKWLARVIWLGKPEFFESDLHLINEVGAATTVGEVRSIIKFYNQQPVARSFLRHRLKIRLSRHKLQALADKVMRPVPADQSAATSAEQALAPTRSGENRAESGSNLQGLPSSR